MITSVPCALKALSSPCFDRRCLHCSPSLCHLLDRWNQKCGSGVSPSIGPWSNDCRTLVDACESLDHPNVGRNGPDIRPRSDSRCAVSFSISSRRWLGCPTSDWLGASRVAERAKTSEKLCTTVSRSRESARRNTFRPDNGVDLHPRRRTHR